MKKKTDKKVPCTTEGCKNKVLKSGTCSTCRSRKTRAKDPIAAYFYHLRNRAKQRPKDFSITMEDWKKWCTDNNFVPYQGDSVDRMDNEHGYHIWNIQKMPLIDNINKYHQHDKVKSYKPVYDEAPF